MPRGVRVMSESAALTFADASTDAVNCGSGSVLDNLSVGTLLTLIYPTSVANGLRNIFSKSAAGGPNGLTFFKRGTDGTQFAMQISRATTHQVVDTGSIMLANRWQCLAFGWNVSSGGPYCHRGTDVTPMAVVTNGPGDGSGAQADDSAANFLMGARATDAAPMKIAVVAIFNRNLSLAETCAWQFSALDEPYPAVMAGCVGLWYPGNEGPNKVIDYSGYHNDGTITGATVSRGVALPARNPMLDSLRRMA